MDNRKIGHHISEQFNNELEDIRNNVLIMGGLVEQQIDMAIQALTEIDIKLAELVIKQDNQVDALEVAIDLECTRILALRQPTAFDLRLLLTVIKIINELEIIGDLAEHIAKMAIQLSYANLKNDQYHELQNLSTLVKGILHSALDAFARMSIDNITEITELDAHVNQEYANILRQLIDHMTKFPREINNTLNILWAVRSIDRISDHTCTICKHLIFMIQGKDAQHLSQSELEALFNSRSRVATQSGSDLNS